jgi:hypothetical protein
MSWRSMTLLIVIVLAMQQQAGAAGHSVSLITSVACKIETISPLDIRKAYLGIRVNIGTVNVKAFRLKGDDKLDDIFFQSVVALSEKSYERHLLRRLIKNGQPRPQEYGSAADLFAALDATPCSIGYAWDSDTRDRVGIKVIRVLWQES